MGPFSSSHLLQFLSSRVCQADQPICHGPSAVWMPLSLVLHLTGLQEPPARGQQPTGHAQLGSPAAAALQQSSARSQQQQQQQHERLQVERPGASAPGAAAAAPSTPTSARATSSSRHNDAHDEDDDGDDYAYGASSAWLKKVRALEAATKARQQREKEAAKQLPSQLQPQAPQQEQQGPLDADTVDAEMEDVCAEAVLEAVSQLRGDQDYLEELHRTIEMDIDTPYTGESTARPSSSSQLAALPTAAESLASPGAPSALELVQLAAAGQSSTASTADRQQQDELLLVLVLDTNVMLQGSLMRFLHKLRQLQEQHGGCVRLAMPRQCPTSGSSAGGQSSSDAAAAAVRVQVLVPWTVLMELDKLKLRPAIQWQARATVQALRQELVLPTHGNEGAGHVHTMFAVQSLQEFRQAAQDCDFGVPASSLVADDRILQCALSKARSLQQQHQQQPESVRAPAWKRQGVLLLTNDKVVQLKAQANTMPVTSLDDVPTLTLPETATTTTTASQPLHEVPLWLIHMLHVAGMHPPWLPTLPDSYPRQQHATAATPRPMYRQQAHTAHKQQLKLKREEEQQRQRQVVEEQFAAAASFLTFLRLTLSGQVLGWFQADLGEHWQDVLLHKPPWGNVQFVDVLQHHWKSTLKGHLPAAAQHKAGHIRTLIEYLVTTARKLDRRSAKGLDLPKLPFNMGVRVMEVLSSFGAQEAANKVEVALAAAVTAPSSSTGVSSAAAVSSDSGAATPAAAAAAAVCHSDTSSAGATVPNMYACIAALQAAATAAGSNTSTGQGQDQDTAAVDKAGTAPGTQPQPANTQPPQQQGQEQEHSHAQQHNAAAAALAAVAAAVAAPRPAGPCLALAQLLLYAISLLQAVFPVLLQLLADAAAAAAATSQAGHEPLQDHSASSSLSVGMAIEQQLRSVVQQLQSLGHQVTLQQQGQQHNWQEDILQLGLLLVQLCSLLLNDKAAGAAVSQQLVQCANEFVAEGAAYLTQSQQQQQAAYQPEQPPGPALMLQQLTAALQHLQHSLSQAVQRA